MNDYPKAFIPKHGLKWINDNRKYYLIKREGEKAVLVYSDGSSVNSDFDEHTLRNLIQYTEIPFCEAVLM